MIFQNKMKSACKAAEQIVAKRERIVQLLREEVGRLSDAAGRLLEAELVLVDRNAKRLIDNSGNPLEDTDTDSTVANIRGKIKRSGAIITGLRSALLTLVPDCIQASSTVSAELPAHHQTISDEFEREWNSAIVAFSRALGKKAAIEKALGRELNFGTPVAIAPEPQTFADALRPQALLDSLRRLVEVAAERVSPPLPGPHRYDDSRVYQLARPYRDGYGLELPEGAYVVDQCLSPGMLALLVSIGHAHEAKDPRISETENVARMAVIQQEEFARSLRLASERTSPLISQSPVDIPAGMTLQDVTHPEITAVTDRFTAGI